MIRKTTKLNISTRKLTFRERSEKKNSLRKIARRSFVRSESRKHVKSESFTRGWEALMDECIEIDNADMAYDFFDEVQDTARKLDIICSDGKPFNARDAKQAWDEVENHVNDEVDKLLDQYGDDLEDIPCIGLKYFGYDETLAVGVYDRGNFEPVYVWEFREAPAMGFENRRVRRNNVQVKVRGRYVKR